MMADMAGVLGTLSRLMICQIFILPDTVYLILFGVTSFKTQTANCYKRLLATPVICPFLPGAFISQLMPKVQTGQNKNLQYETVPGHYRPYHRYFIKKKKKNYRKTKNKPKNLQVPLSYYKKKKRKKLHINKILMFFFLPGFLWKIY